MEENPIMFKVWQCFDDLYNKFDSVEFATPLTVDLFCCICGRFLIFAIEDNDSKLECKFCTKCWENIKNSSQFLCDIHVHEPQILNRETMAKKLVNQYPIDVLIICPYKCGNLYTILNFEDHCLKCKNRPKESSQEVHKYEAHKPSYPSPVPTTKKTKSNPTPPEDQGNYPIIPKEDLMAEECSAKKGVSPLVTRDDAYRHSPNTRDKSFTAQQERRQYAGLTPRPDGALTESPQGRNGNDNSPVYKQQ